MAVRHGGDAGPVAESRVFLRVVSFEHGDSMEPEAAEATRMLPVVKEDALSRDIFPLP